MDLPENDHYEWSDWFTKASPASSEQESPAPEAPVEAEAETVPDALAQAEAEPIQDTPVPDAPFEAEPEPVSGTSPDAGTEPVEARAADDHGDESVTADLQAEPAPGVAEPVLAEAEPDLAEGEAEEAADAAEPFPGPRGPDSPTTSLPILPILPPAGTPGSGTTRRAESRPILDPQPTRPQPAISRPDPQPTRPQRIIPRPDPQPTRPQPAVSWPVSPGTRPEAQMAPAEGNRPAGALPWILPTDGQASFQAADALTTARTPAAPPADPAAAPPVTGEAAATEQAPAPAADPPAPAEQAPPAEKTAGRKPRGQAHAATYKEPEVVSGADTVMLPKLRAGQATAAAGAAAAAKRTTAARASATGTDAPPVKVDEQPTTIMPVQTLPRPAPAPPEQPYRPSQRRKWISRGVLLAILLMQAVLSLRLRNTAFEDEAQYLYAGRLEIAHLFHGAPLPINFASYFSGSPVLYPVLGAAANNVGGLAAARAVSTLEMLATTVLLYAISRRLFNERVAICAALLFSVTAAITFLGNFATFDASCLFLLAVAAWIMVRTATSRWPLFLLAAPVAALAVATKYAGLLFVPTIAVLPVLTAWPYHRRRVFAYPVIFGIAVAALLYGAVRWGGHSYIQALQQTTTSRAAGTTPLSQILWESVKWGGLQFGVALLGAIAYAWRPRTDPDEEISPAGSRLRRILLGLLLIGTALLAPAYQAHLHTDVSFHKHIGFGLFFAAPMAGVGLARIIGDHFRRPQLGIGIWGVAILLGMTQSAILFGGWGNSSGLVKVLSRQLKPGARYLVEVPEVPVYYLEGRKGALATQFYSTFVIFYVDPQGQTLTGDAGFEVAIKNGFFQVIAYEGTITPAVDNILASELKKSSLYRLAATVPDNTPYHSGTYYVWVKKTASTAGTGKVTSKAGT
jgi:4-amino-4-deoxy-L-arabinose transferase-like glycosyltransferase